MVGIGKGAENGILIKDAESLETARKVNAIVLDKTGTLTRGVFRVQEVHPFGGLTADELVAWTAAAESGSNHP